MRVISCLILTVCLIAPDAYAQEVTADEEAAPAEEEPAGGFVHGLLFYFPNRVFDLLDVVRLRVRVGPGIAVGMRATELADLRLGGYGSVYAGIPGPRLERKAPRPAGFEAFGGTEVRGLGPGGAYGAGEIGLDAQLAVLGGAIGFDPLELLDFAGGFVLLDIRDDDL